MRTEVIAHEGAGGIDNLTPFGFATAFGYDLNDRAMVVLCVAGRFQIPPAGRSHLHEGPLALADEQPPPPMADRHWSSPADSSLRYAGQGSLLRPGADIYLQGSAWAPQGEAVEELLTRIRLGPCTKEVLAIGDRTWVRGFTSLRATAPARFVSLPLRYERSYGGTAYAEDGRIIAQEPRNPIGCGLYDCTRSALDSPLPNFEEPAHRIRAWDSSVIPCGYGPIPGSWQPRLAQAGTFDQQWVNARIPYWPQDTDPRFFCAAASGLIAPEPFIGGEPVVLDGFSPEGTVAFCLPSYRVHAKSIYLDRTIRGLMRLDGVMLEPDERAVTLYWRRAVPLEKGARIYIRSIVRLLEPWEEVPE